MNKDYTILVSSCDRYADLWDPFFTFFEKNGSELAMRRIILNTESLGYQMEGLQVETLHLYSANDTPTWSERMIAHLRQIDTEYVLLLLDDFFLEQPVDTKIVDFCLRQMQKDRRIVHFGFVPTLWDGIDDARFDGFERRKVNTPFRVNCQAGLWRRSELLALLRKHETPWEFEVFGSIRSRLRLGTYYVAKSGTRQAFIYDWFNGGAIHRGKWTNHAVELLQANYISLDFSLRGYDTDIVLHPKDIPLDENEKTFWGRMMIRLHVLRKHWRSLV